MADLGNQRAVKIGLPSSWHGSDISAGLVSAFGQQCCRLPVSPHRHFAPRVSVVAGPALTPAVIAATSQQKPPGNFEELDFLLMPQMIPGKPEGHTARLRGRESVILGFRLY